MKEEYKNFIIKLNEFYNKNLEQRISYSIFSIGGLGSFFLKNKMISWISRLHGVVLDAGCGDKKWQEYIPKRSKYVSLDYLPVSSDSPWRVSFPKINADATNLPIRENSVDSVINVFVLEHVKSPPLLIRELARVIKPGGLLLLAGPGDILMTHGEPNCYFNMTKWAYNMYLKECNMEILEEYYPVKFWMSLFVLIYQKLVRNDIYNRHSTLKLLQIPVFLISLFVSPPLNLLAYLLDVITPFDTRGYNTYMVLARKTG